MGLLACRLRATFRRRLPGYLSVSQAAGLRSLEQVTDALRRSMRSPKILAASDGASGQPGRRAARPCCRAHPGGRYLANGVIVA